METNRSLQKCCSRRKLHASIELWRNNLLDWDVRVEDDRRDVATAAARLQDSERQRDAAQRHLSQLLELHDEVEAVAATFGPEIAARLSEASI